MTFNRSIFALGATVASAALAVPLAAGQASASDTRPASYSAPAYAAGQMAAWDSPEQHRSRSHRWPRRTKTPFRPTPTPIRSTTSPAPAPTTSPAPSPTPTTAPPTAPVTTVRDRLSASYRDAAGTTSTYHLFTSKVVNARPVGLVVYLDGDGMYGHRNPTSTWALGGSGGVVAQAGSRGYATLSIATPSADRTFWTKGAVNAAYVASLIESIRTELGVQRTWLVGYSGGSQLITKYLLPAYSSIFASGGGAVITGGGGAPSGSPTIDPALKTGFRMLWYTGSLDDGTNSDDGYNALADAKRGEAWYAARGVATSRQEPAGVDHEDLGTRFGTVLGSQLDSYPAR